MSRVVGLLMAAVLAAGCGSDRPAPIKVDDPPSSEVSRKRVGDAATKKTMPPRARQRVEAAAGAKLAEGAAEPEPAGDPPASVTVGDPDPGGTEADYSELKVYAWQWRDEHDAPNPKGNAYSVGRTPYWFEIGGLTEKDGKYTIAVKSRIRNAEGMVMYEAEGFNLVELEVDPSHPHRATHTDSAQIPTTGEFHLELDLRDEATGKLFTHSQVLHIE